MPGSPEAMCRMRGECGDKGGLHWSTLEELISWFACSDGGQGLTECLHLSEFAIFPCQELAWLWRPASRGTGVSSQLQRR